MKLSHKFHELCCALFVVLCLTMIHMPMWSKGHTLGWDAMRESWGDLSYSIQALSHGYFPFWNHLERGGYPFLGDPQTAVLYPINWLIYMGGMIFGTGPWLAVLRSLCHYLISAYGCQLLSKRWGGSARLGLLFSLGYTLSGRLLKSKDNAGIWTMVWLPWLILAVERLIEEPRRRSASLLAICCSCAFYAGYPPNFARSLFLLIPWFTYRIYAQLRSQSWSENKTFIKILSLSCFQSITITLLLCGPGIISTLQVLEGSERQRLSIAQLLSSRFQPYDILDFIVPRFVHHQSYALMYCGLTIAIFAVSALWIKRIKGLERLFWASALLVSTLWSCGQHTPILRFFVDYVPTFNLWRIAEQYAFLATFSLSVLALKCGISLEEEESEWSADEVATFGRKREINSIIFRVSLGCFILVSLIYVSHLWQSGHIQNVFGMSVVLSAIITGCLGFKQLRTKHLWISLIILSVVDIGYQQQTLVNISQPIPNPRRDHLVKLDQGQRFADEGLLRWRPASRVGLPDLLGRYSTMVDQRWARYRQQSEKSHNLYAWGGVQQLFQRRKSHPKRIRHAVPYAYWTSNELWFTEANQVLKAMKKRSPKAGLVAFRESHDVDDKSLNSLFQEPINGTSVSVYRSSYGSILLTLNTPAEGILVINESYSKWWRARIDDGDWFPTKRMNYLFQGLRVASGQHTVELEYREKPTLIAMCFAILTCLYLISTFKYRKRRTLEEDF